MNNPTEVDKILWQQLSFVVLIIFEIMYVDGIKSYIFKTENTAVKVE